MPFFRAIWTKPIIRVVKRNILSEAYGCTDKWNSRFSCKAFGNASAGDLGTEILYRLSNRAPVTPLDYDIFVNKIQQTDNSFLDFLEKITYKFRETQNSLCLLNSSSHAIVRAYIHHQSGHRLLDLLRNRSLTGVFLDEISANLLMTEFLRRKSIDEAGCVMWEMCLQSHLDQFPLTPYISALWLHTILESVKSGTLFERNVFAAEEQQEEDEDVDYRRVPYLPNPNHDGWFDIDRPRLQIGQCAIALANAIGAITPDTSLIPPNIISELSKLVPGLRLLGLALLEDAPGLLNLTQAFAKSGVCVGKDVVDAVEKLIDSSDRRADDSEVTRGHPQLLTDSEVSSALKKFIELSPRLAEKPSAFFEIAASLIPTITSDPEILAHEKSRVEALYSEFEAEREAVYTREMERLRRRNVLSEVRGRLRDLADQEERLSYFSSPEAASEIELRAWLAPRTRRERRWSRMKEWKRDLKHYQQRQQGGREAIEESS